MKKLLIIGIGTGNPDHVTIQAINAMNNVDVFFIPNKRASQSELRRIREDICERFIERKNYRTVGYNMPDRTQTTDDYRQSVLDWHQDISDRYERLILEELGPRECGAFLVWGDPSLYDSTLRIIQALEQRGIAFDYEVIPGISSMQALAARHRIPLSQVGQPVLVTPGRKLAEGFPANVDNVVIMLDSGQTLEQFPDQDAYIHWGANIGTADEILIAGGLHDVLADIERGRTAIKEKQGWCMEISLLRRTQE